MKHRPYALSPSDAFVVLDVIRDVCAHRGWALVAAHVRSTHTHVIVDSSFAPKRIITDFKAYASRRMNLNDGVQVRWARGGNVARLLSEASVRAAIRYVVGKQGYTMALFVNDRGREAVTLGFS